MAETTRRDVELRIRANDLSNAQFQQVKSGIDGVTAALDKEIASANKGQISLAELRESMTKLEQAGKALTSIAALIDRFKDLETRTNGSSQALTQARDKLTQYRTSLETVTTTTEQHETALTALVRTVERAETAHQKNAETLEGTRKALQQSGVDTNDLAAAERNLKSAADQVGPALTRLSDAQLAYARNVRVARQETQALTKAERDAAEQRKQTERDAKAAEDALRQRILARRQGYEAIEAAANRAAGAEGRTSVGGGRGGTLGIAGQSQQLLGLRPYQLQNLSYQINDIISGLASGQKLTQILAQQGGQVIQIFNQNLFSLLRYLPQVAIAAAAVTVAIGALNHALQDQAAIRQYQGIITATVDGIRYQASALQQIQHDIRSFGASWDDAGTAIRTAIGAGVAQNRIKDFAQASQDITDIYKKDFPDAMKQLVEGFNKGRDGIVALNNEYGFLSVAQFKHIQQLFDENKGQQATTEAFDIFAQKLRDGAKISISPTTDAVRGLRNAWNELLTALGNSSIFQGLTDLVAGLLTKLTALLSKIEAAGTYIKNSFSGNPALPEGPLIDPTTGLDLRTLRPPGAATPPSSATTGGAFKSNVPLSTPELQQLGAIMAEAIKQFPGGYTAVATSGLADRASGTPNHPAGRAIDVKLVDAQGRDVAGYMGQDVTGVYTKFAETVSAVQQKLYPELNGRLAAGTQFGSQDAGHFDLGGTRGTRGPLGAPLYDPNNSAQQIKAANDIAAADRNALEALNSSNHELQRQRIQREAIAEAEKQTTDQNAIQAHANAKLKEYDIQLEQQRQQYAQEDRIRRIQDGKDANEIEKAGYAAAARARAQAKDGIISEGDLRQAQLRGEEEVRNRLKKADQEKDAFRSLMNQKSALDRSNELKDTTSLEARQRAVADQYATIGRALDKFKTDFPNTTKDVNAFTTALEKSRTEATQRAGAGFYSDKLNEVINERNALVQTYNTLLDKGLVTSEEAETKIKAAFDRARPAITELTAEFEKYLATADKIDPTKIDLYLAKIKEFRAQAVYISPLFQQVKDAVNNAFGQGVVTMFDTIAESIGNVINKTGTWKDVLTATRNAVLGLFATLLKAVAEAILKYEALKIASAFTGSGGGGFGGIIGSLFGGSSTAPIAKYGGLSTAEMQGLGIDTAATGGGFFSSLASIFHGGGVVGRDGAPQRLMPASWFAGAPRYHSGTVVGLGAGERAAVLQDGEEVLSRSSPRNVMNGGGVQSIRSVLVLDPDLIPQAMSGSSGEQTVISHIKNNIPTLRAMLKG